MKPSCLRILGTRGIPAEHGGFETFAEHLALHLVSVGWRVVVYCQEDGHGPITKDVWKGVERVRIPVAYAGPKGTTVFDWRATAHAAKRKDLCLTLGYNTALFCAALRLRKVPNLINMDGMEWTRSKWGSVAKSWFWLNERAGCWLGDHLIADHPQIQAHLATRVRGSKITTIPYGADPLHGAPEEPVRSLGLEPGRFLTLIARPEPENSILEVVEGFSARTRGVDLVVLGNFSPDNAYHRKVLGAAGPEVKFMGAIYDKAIVQALRFHCLAYVHGHKVGGTNPSLVEAMGAGNAVLAHDNRFNRWVVGDGARYFDGASDFSATLANLLQQPALLSSMRTISTNRFREEFTWQHVMSQYELLLAKYLPPAARLSLEGSAADTGVDDLRSELPA